MSILKQLEHRGNELERFFDEGLGWLKDNDSLNRSNEQRLHDAQRSVRKVGKVLDKKPVFALYGASQVGKSYLAHIILSGDQPDLMVDLGTEQANFLEQINPPGGGAEATGVVTRFTVDPNENAQYPVLVRFLSVEDICLILCKAYYDNFSDGIPMDRDTVAQRTKEVENRVATQTHTLTGVELDEIRYSLKDLENNLNKYFRMQRTHWEDVKAAGVWEACAQHLPTLLTDTASFANMLSVLWMGHDGLTQLAQTLLEGLSKLGWNERGHLGAQAVLREQYGGQAIVDVATLKHLGNDSETLELLVQQQVRSIERATLSALTKEIVLSISRPDASDEDNYLSRTDIMDFPGARSPIQRTGDSEEIHLPFLRGKVAHLFDQYSRDYEINNLLFCLPDQKNEVTDLPQILQQWIELNVGSSAEDRQRLIESRGSSPLMVVFTWFNRQLDFDLTNDSAETLDRKWEKRFQRFFLDEMVNEHEWCSNWLPTGSFRNIFPLRDFSFSKGTFSGYESEGRETGYVPLPENPHFDSAEVFQEMLKQSFIDSDWTQQFLEDPTSTWNACAMPNNDGSAPIISAMEQASTSSGLEVHAQGILDRAKAQLEEELTRHYHSDDIAARHQQAERLSADLNLTLMSNAAGKNQELLVALQDALSISGPEVSEWLATQNTNQPRMDDGSREVFLLAHDMIHQDMTASEIVEAFRSHYRLSSEEQAVEAAWNQWRVDLRSLYSTPSTSQESPLVARALEHFSAKRLSFCEERHGPVITHGLDQALFVSLLEQLKQGLATRQIAHRISDFLKGNSAFATTGQVDKTWLGQLIAHQWNEYVFHLGDSYYSDEEREKVHFQTAQHPHDPETVFELLTTMFEPTPAANLLQVHTVPRLETVKQLIKRWQNLFLVNCGFANYNLEANEQLGRLLNSIKSNG